MIVHRPLDPVIARSRHVEGASSWSLPRPRGDTRVGDGGGVDSVQWIDLPGAPALDLPALERAYFAWVPRIGFGLAAADAAPLGTDQPLSIRAGPLGWPTAIRMSAPVQDPRRRARRVLGGLLAYPGGELAFELLDLRRATRLRVALTGFRPRAPLLVYLVTQRHLHERSTFAFLRQVARHAK